MARGKAHEKDRILRTLKPFLQLGCSVQKACDYAGVPYTTIHTWILNDEALRIEITALQNEISTIARKNWKKAIVNGDVHRSVDWLSKKEKDEFADRIEQTGKGGGAIEIDDTARNKTKSAISKFLSRN